MDFPQFHINRPEFKEFRRPTLSQHAHVEVVLVDRSQSGGFPQVFQLNDQNIASMDQLDRLRQEIANLHHDAFQFLGEALQIDHDKKVITLTDDNILTYHYLIVVANAYQTREFNAFLPTLKDVLLLEALNVKSKIADGKKKQLPSPFEIVQTQGFTASEGATSSSKVAPLVKQRIAETDSPSGGTSVHPKRLCQVKT